jgi:hypothetical protein
VADCGSGDGALRDGGLQLDVARGPVAPKAALAQAFVLLGLDELLADGAGLVDGGSLARVVAGLVAEQLLAAVLHELQRADLLGPLLQVRVDLVERGLLLGGRQGRGLHDIERLLGELAHLVAGLGESGHAFISWVEVALSAR